MIVNSDVDHDVSRGPPLDSGLPLAWHPQFLTGLDTWWDFYKDFLVSYSKGALPTLVGLHKTYMNGGLNILAFASLRTAAVSSAP